MRLIFREGRFSFFSPGLLWPRVLGEGIDCLGVFGITADGSFGDVELGGETFGGARLRVILTHNLRVLIYSVLVFDLLPLLPIPLPAQITLLFGQVPPAELVRARSCRSGQLRAVTELASSALESCAVVDGCRSGSSAT